MIYVIGGIAIDIIVSKNKFIKHTSNIANLNISTGGVGFNIFKNIDTKNKCFISTIGNDIPGKMILKDLKKDNEYDIFLFEQNSFNNFNNNISNSRPTIFLQSINNSKTSFYNALMQNGELLYGASNFDILENHLSFNFITKILNNLKPKDIVVLDANLNSELIKLLIKYLEKKEIFIFFETISIEKTKRVKKYFNNIFFSSPEINEFKTLINLRTIPLSKFIKNKTFSLLKNKNIKYLLVTKGRNGSTLYFIEKDRLKKIDFYPNEKLNLKSTNGAGDYLFSKVIENLSKILEKKENILFSHNCIKKDEIINCIKESIIKTEEYLKKLNNI